MINTNSVLSGLWTISSQFMLEQYVYKDGNEFLSPEEISDNIKWIEISEEILESLEMSGSLRVLGVIKNKLDTRIKQSTFSAEIRVLMESIKDECRKKRIYYYPQAKMNVFENWLADWAPTLSSFPSSRRDILAGVDLWSLGHSTASVFHFMRVLEHGIKSLAKNVGKEFNVQNWQNILEEIESEVRKQSTSLPRGSDKSERLRFLSQAVKEFHFFKDGWRNHVSHSRAFYDEGECRILMDHVRSFMNVISKEISETS